jgi:hypothetical protein
MSPPDANRVCADHRAAGPVVFGEPNRALSSAAGCACWRSSFSVDLKDGTWYDHEAGELCCVFELVPLHTKCTWTEPLDWLQHRVFLFETPQTGYQSPRPSIIATYDYQDEGGTLLSQVCRFEPKDFRQRRPDDNGGWVWSVKGVRHVHYRLPQLLENDDRVICIVEGEKAADRLWKLGVPATCSAGGAGKWREAEQILSRGRRVMIIPDRDPQKVHPKTKEPLFHPDGRPMLPVRIMCQMVADRSVMSPRGCGCWNYGSTGR